MKLNTPHDFLCHECFKNIYIVGVRNVEGENHSEHTVNTDPGIESIGIRIFSYLDPTSLLSAREEHPRFVL